MLLAAADRRDRNHLSCARLLSESPGPLVVPSLVVTEAAYLIGSRLGDAAELAFGRSFLLGQLVVEPVLDSDWERICELAERYHDLPLGLVDASIVALAERHGLDTLASLDHRHLGVVRPSHIPRFKLVPERLPS